MYNKHIDMIGIYKITSPTNKTYVGQSINIEKRFKQYERLDCKKQPKLYNSFSKHGVKNHIFEILEECSLDELNTKEVF
jgi:group I intron endonuclease